MTTVSTARFLRRTALIGLLATSSLLAAGTAIAQTTTSSDLDPLEGLRTQDGGSGNILDNNNSGSMFDIYHRMNLNNGQSSQQFYNQQRENIDAAATDFRAEQLRRMQQQEEQDTQAPSEN
ncbi:MAG: hypothetical protein IGR80_10760 [Synechococcales cyanobacterium K44_A2020_017]|nr:hypothetical protein [Synechococcales cyanobacterium K32_A2020_035]MBF2095223.1 hypothetical protein [Synechococcales cyanobacterium K44_A2020_017]